MPQLIVSLTTIPPRVGHLETTIRSIQEQSLVPDAIELNIPRSYSRRGFGSFDRRGLPSGCEVIWVDRDLGPATKVLPTVARYWGTDTRIVYCDDDQRYDPQWLERLVRVSEANPGAVIADRAIQSRKQEIKHVWAQKKLMYRALRAASLGRWKPSRGPFRDDIAEGFGGVLIRPEYLQDDAFEIPEVLWSVDDVWLSGMYERNGHRLVLTNYDAHPHASHIWVDNHRVGDINALIDYETQGYDRLAANVACISYMREKFGVFSGERRTA